jgi:hypothetical protein
MTLWRGSITQPLCPLWRWRHRRYDEHRMALHSGRVSSDHDLLDDLQGLTEDLTNMKAGGQDWHAILGCPPGAQLTACADDLPDAMSVIDPFVPTALMIIFQRRDRYEVAKAERGDRRGREREQIDGADIDAGCAEARSGRALPQADYTSDDGRCMESAFGVRAVLA